VAIARRAKDVAPVKAGQVRIKTGKRKGREEHHRIKKE
jgi:hypothetical protein